MHWSGAQPFLGSTERPCLAFDLRQPSLPMRDQLVENLVQHLALFLVEDFQHAVLMRAGDRKELVEQALALGHDRQSRIAPIVDVRFFVTALLIQKETGGNLAEILDGLSRVIRERFRIYRDVQVRTAQGRLTAGILIALPIGMMGVLSILNPKYVGILFSDPMGPVMLIIAASLQLIGSVILWKIIHFEV